MRNILIAAVSLLLLTNAALAGIRPRPVLLTVRAPQSSLGTSQNDKAFREALISGGTEAATGALLALLPGHDSLSSSYGAVIGCVPQVTGELDLEALASACPEYHRWRAKDIVICPNRRIAILQWIAQKFWEKPAGAEKTSLFCRFTGDLGDLIDTRVISFHDALSMLCDSQYDFDSIEPNALPQCLVDFCRRGIRALDAEHREQVIVRLMELREVSRSPAQHAELIAIMSCVSANVSTEDSDWDRYSIRGMPSKPVSREYYMSLPDATLESLQENIIADDEGAGLLRGLNRRGGMALERFK